MAVNEGSIGSDIGLQPILVPSYYLKWCWFFLIAPLGTNFSEIRIKVQNFPFIKMCLKVLSVKWQAFGPGEDGLIVSHEVCGAFDRIMSKGRISTLSASLLYILTINDMIRIIYTMLAMYCYIHDTHFSMIL